MKITAAQFKARCLKLMDQVQAGHEEIIITKRGKPVARLVPIEDGPSSAFGFLKQSVTVSGDIVAPLEERWQADTFKPPRHVKTKPSNKPPQGWRDESGGRCPDGLRPAVAGFCARDWRRD